MFWNLSEILKSLTENQKKQVIFLKMFQMSYLDSWKHIALRTHIHNFFFVIPEYGVGKYSKCEQNHIELFSLFAYIFS